MHAIGDENPYRSPTAPESGPLIEVRANPGPAQARLESGKMLFRRVVIESPIEAIVEFNGRSLREVLRVNHEVAASQTSWWRITPRFDVRLLAGEAIVPLTVRLRFGNFLRLRGFRIESGEELLYAEGEEF